LAERLLSPELVQSRALLASLDATALRGDGDLPQLAAQLEAAVCVLSRADRCRLLMRRLPSTTFVAPQVGAPGIEFPALTVALSCRPWGLTAQETRAR